MKLAILQPYFFPYIGYFQLINHVNKFVFFDDVNFIKRGWINRNRILINGQEKLFTIPLIGVSSNKKINEIFVHDEQDWRKKFIRKIELSYKKAPYFDKVIPIIRKPIQSKEKKISNIAKNSIKIVSDYLQIETEFINTSKSYDNVNLKGAKRLIDICKKENADEYVNPIGGMDLYTAEDFIQSGIKLRFIKPKKIKYDQNQKQFIPNLSIIDLLMHNDKTTVIDMLNKFKLE